MFYDRFPMYSVVCHVHELCKDQVVVKNTFLKLFWSHCIKFGQDFGGVEFADRCFCLVLLYANQIYKDRPKPSKLYLKKMWLRTTSNDLSTRSNCSGQLQDPGGQDPVRHLRPEPAPPTHQPQMRTRGEGTVCQVNLGETHEPRYMKVWDIDQDMIDI